MLDGPLPQGIYFVPHPLPQAQMSEPELPLKREADTEVVSDTEKKQKTVVEVEDPPTPEKSYNIVYKPDGTVDTSRMIPAPKPDIHYPSHVPGCMPQHQKQYLIKLLKLVKRLKDAVPFLAPVDTVALAIPFYYNFVPKPMDLLTIEARLESDLYRTPEEVQDDFNLMVDNCARFNGDKSLITRMGRNIQALFEKLLLNVPLRDPSAETRKRRAMSPENGVPTIRRDTSSGRPKREIHPPRPRDMPYDIRPRSKRLLTDLRFASLVVKELMLKKHEAYNYPFLEPVDPVALDCPTYFDIVKTPMDLLTIQNRLLNNQYDLLSDFYRDAKLVFLNCYAFNPEGTPVNIMGHKLEEVFDARWAERPVHASPEPRSDYEYDEDFDEDDEREIEHQVSNTHAIQVLEAQIERMKAELEKMKRSEYDKVRRRLMRQKRKGKKTRRPEEAIELTFDMKKELLEQIAHLNEKKLQHVMKIINESVPDLQKDDEDEIELDMDMLDDETLLKLYNYVVAKNSVKKRMNGNGKSKRKRKTDTDKTIDILRLRLEAYDNRAASSEEEDDSDEESSEEE